MVYIGAQTALQSKFRPGALLPWVRDFHREAQEWRFNCSMDSAMRVVKEAVEKIDDFYVYSHKGDVMKVNYLTKAKWLDQVVFKFTSVGPHETLATAEGVSTGLLPLAIPLAPIANAALCWFPFGDGGKISESMRRIRTTIETIKPNIKVLPKTTKMSKTNPNAQYQLQKEAEAYQAQQK
mmetsp:Transcript_16730/g.29615  ORF Transcript_16730/g.29615 Transcript_16730/m.29615 type:complete len:180 (-) Transcript_16730:44-583(-)